MNNKLVSCKAFNADQLNKGIVIYEVIRIINRTPLFYQEHVERFYNSVKNSGFRINLSAESIALRIKSLIETNKLEDVNIRFQISFTRDNKATFSAWACPFFYPKNEFYESGASLSTIVAHRDNPNVKIYNRKLINNVFSRIGKDNIYEVLLLNKDGFITEGSRSNIFFVDGNRIITPPLSSVLPGITRLNVIKIASKLEIDCNEVDINYNSLQLFDGAFITGTSPKVLPIGKIDGVIFNPDHPTISVLMKSYNEIVVRYIDSFSWSHYV